MISFLILISIAVSCCTYETRQIVLNLLRHPISGLKMCPVSDAWKILSSRSKADCVNKCMADNCAIFKFVEDSKTCNLYDEYKRNIRNYQISEECASFRASDRCDIHLIGFNSNLAHLKNGKMSSQNSGRSFSNAVDGQRIGRWNGIPNVAATTNWFPIQWMTLDLNYNFIIKNVALWPRIELPVRIDNLIVKMSKKLAFYNNPISDSASYLCNLTYLDATQGYVNASCMNCDQGFRYVALIANRSDPEIDLAEIEVYGHPENCPFIFSYLNQWNKCMLLLNEMLMWNESISQCASHSAVPIYINSTKETLDIVGFSGAILKRIVWTGGFWNYNLQSWSWWGKEDLAWQNNWQNGGSNDTIQCVALNITSLNMFVMPCDEKLPTICQISLNND